MELSSEFIDEINCILPHDEVTQLIEALDKEPTTSVRRNVRKLPNDVFATTKTPVKWCANGAYLPQREQFTFDPLFQSGSYYVQDASSMIIQNVVSALASNTDLRYLDACAAPGGKTTAAIDALSDGSLVIANEYMNNRAQALRENIMKWGAPNCVVVNNDTTIIGAKFPNYFDIIAADVPCSGEGMFRKDSEAVSQWTPALVAQCASRQKEIIDNLWEALRPGGYLIYSTCTYNRFENEEMINYIISTYEAESIDMQFPTEWNIRQGIDTPHHCYRFMPHRTEGEGLFISVLHKNGDETSTIPTLKKGKDKPLSVPMVDKLLNNRSQFSLNANKEKIIAIPSRYADEIAYISKNMHMIYAGVELGTIKGKDFIPSQALALSPIYNSNSFPIANVNYQQAIAYLRGESIMLTDTPKGIVALQYGKVIIGFAKNLGNRANNLYPKEWRIKSTYVPSTPPSVI